MEVTLDEQKWGWKMKDGMYVPIATDLKDAPPNILSVISCMCQTSSGTSK